MSTKSVTLGCTTYIPVKNRTCNECAANEGTKKLIQLCLEAGEPVYWRK